MENWASKAQDILPWRVFLSRPQPIRSGGCRSLDSPARRIALPSACPAIRERGAKGAMMLLFRTVLLFMAGPVLWQKTIKNIFVWLVFIGHFLIKKRSAEVVFLKKELVFCYISFSALWKTNTGAGFQLRSVRKKPSSVRKKPSFLKWPVRKKPSKRYESVRKYTWRSHIFFSKIDTRWLDDGPP